MAFTEILYDVSEHIGTVTLNRPAKLNAWTPTMDKEVQAAIEQAEKDDAVRVIVITGAGRSFCAGMDIGFLGDLAGGKSPSERVEHLRAHFPSGPKRPDARPDFQTLYSYFPAVEKPVIAALNGPTVGLGLVVALYCDLRFASDAAKFTTAFSRRGLIAEHGLAWMMPRIVGHANAVDLLLSARQIGAAEALHMGLVNRVFPAASFMADVRAYAADLASQVSPRSTRIIKRQLYDAFFQNLGEAITAANHEMFQSLLSNDFREGVTHFLEKRPSKFTGN
jgi:enoyl-CoA hydratase/carnithine racemase